MDRFSSKFPWRCVWSAIVAILVFLSAQNAAAQLKINAVVRPEITVGNDFGVGARAMGMGGAFIGVADDSTALYWNPAGLSQIKRMEFFGALSHERLGADTEYFGNSDSTFASNVRPNSFGIVFPVPVYRGGLAFALGVNRVQSFDSRVRFNGFNSSTEMEDPDFYQLSIDDSRKGSGGIYSWDFGAAVDVGPSVSLGATLSLLSGSDEYERVLSAMDTKDIDLMAEHTRIYIIDSDYSGVEAKLGLLARPIRQIRLGLTIDVPLVFSVDEFWSEDIGYFYDDGTEESEPDAGDWPYEISRPFRFGAGIAACPVPGAILAAGVLYTDWTQTEYDDPPSDDIDPEEFINDYRDTLQLRIGGEYTIPGTGLRIRAGYIYDPLPYKPKWVNIDTDRQFITAGLGMVLDEVFSLDLTYARGFWGESTDNLKEDWDANRIFLSAGCRF